MRRPSLDIETLAELPRSELRSYLTDIGSNMALHVPYLAVHHKELAQIATREASRLLERTADVEEVVSEAMFRALTSQETIDSLKVGFGR